MATIFSLLLLTLLVVGGFYLVCYCIGGIIGILAAIAESPIFWAAVFGGLVAYLLGYRSDQALITGMIICGGVVTLWYICNFFDCFDVLFWLMWMGIIALIIYILYRSGVDFSGIIDLGKETYHHILQKASELF